MFEKFLVFVALLWEVLTFCAAEALLFYCLGHCNPKNSVEFQLLFLAIIIVVPGISCAICFLLTWLYDESQR